MKLTIIQAIERAYNYANLNSEDDDIIYKAIYKLKVLKHLDYNFIEAIYNYIADRMGYSNKPMFSNEDAILLNSVIGYNYFDDIS